MKKTLQIISSTHAREINPWGKEKPIKPMEWEDHNVWDKYWFEKTNWQQSELSLKEYRIEEIDNLDLCPIKIGSIHSAETNEELNTCIIL